MNKKQQQQQRTISNSRQAEKELAVTATETTTTTTTAFTKYIFVFFDEVSLFYNLSVTLSVCFAIFVSYSLSLTDWLTQKATAVCVIVVGKLEHFAFFIFTILPSQGSTVVQA